MIPYYKCYLCGKFFTAPGNEPSYTVKFNGGQIEAVCTDCFKAIIQHVHDQNAKRLAE